MGPWKAVGGGKRVTFLRSDDANRQKIARFVHLTLRGLSTCCPKSEQGTLPYF